MKTKFNGILTLLIALSVQFVFAQKTVSGTVSDEAGPLPGVNILIKGTTSGTQTDFDGNYTLMASEGQTLVFSYVGYDNVEKIVGASSVYNVMMTGSNVLDEVVIVGYGQKSKKSTLSSAVSTVSEKELQEMNPSTSLGSMIQGKTAGVQVVSQNGKPGNGAFIRVRGVTNLQGGSNPLVIIDGVWGTSSDLSALNPNDVVSVSVLKDAATTSLYGAAGADGVILVSTKRGAKNSEAKINFQSRIGMSQKIKDNFQMMNAEQKLQYEREIGIGTGSNVSSQEEWDQLVSYDHNWEDDLLKKGYLMSNALSFQGGSEKSNYFLSLANDQDTGIIDGLNAYNRSTARINFDSELKEWVKLNLTFGLSNIAYSDPRDRNNTQNPFRAMYDYNPYETYYEVDGQGNYITDDEGNPVYNYTHTGFPIAEAIRNNTDDRSNLIFWGGLGLDFNLYEGLVFSTSVYPKYNKYRREYFLKPGSVLDEYVGDPDKPGSKTDNGSNTLSYTLTNKLNWNKSFNDIHNLNVLAFMDYSEVNYDSYSLSSKGFATSDLDIQGVAAEATAATTYKEDRTKVAYALKMDYDYDSKYILSGTIRREGDSRFGTDNKFGTFGGASVAWVITEEDFLKGNNTFNNLKLRFSYGVTGNTSMLDYYDHLSTLGLGSYNNLSDLFPSQVGNPSLRWEKTAQMDLGLEFRLFNNRIFGVIDGYMSESDGLIQDKPLSWFGGYSSQPYNIGNLSNKGLEIELGADIIRNTDFNWTLGGNISFYSTKVEALDEGKDVIISNFIQQEGEDAFTYYLPRYAGVNPDNGDALYYDVDGEIVLDPSGQDVPLTGKTPFAKFDGGIYTNVRYKALELSSNFNYRNGNYILNYMESNMLSDGENYVDNQRLDAFNYWREPGDTDVLPRPNNNTNQITDRFLQDGSYIRLKSLALSYTLPEKFLENNFIESLKLFCQGQNLWTYTPHYKGNPEVGVGSGETQTDFVIPGEFSLYSYPQTQSVSFGVDIKF